MAELHMLVGIAGSGKSTFANELKERYKDKNVEIFSSDALRLELYGDENDQTHNNQVFEELHKRILTHLNQGGVAIYDACNLTYKTRMTFLKKVHMFVYKACHIIPATYEEAVARQELRERKVPAEVIKRQICSFQTPYWHEGWNEICIHTTLDNKIKLHDILMANHDVSHDNPNHQYGIGRHCMEAFFYAHDVGFSETIQEAALYHDIGKPFVKSFTNRRGESTEIAHYYGHQNYGAYLALLSDGTDFQSSLLAISFLICYHMEEFVRKEKVDKFYELVGESRALQLKQLHECDLHAH